MRRQVQAARSVRAGLLIVGVVAALAAAGCGDSNPASPTTSNTTAITSTVSNTPRVTSVSPTSGADTGGNILTITGDYFSTSAVVTIGGSPALNVTCISSTELQVTTPAGAVGAAAAASD